MATDSPSRSLKGAHCSPGTFRVSRYYPAFPTSPWPNGPSAKSWARRSRSPPCAPSSCAGRWSRAICWSFGSALPETKEWRGSEARAAGGREAFGGGGAPGPGIGYLVGIRDAHFTGRSLPAGRRLRVAVRLQGGASPLAVYAVTIGQAGHEVAAGTLSTFVLANP